MSSGHVEGAMKMAIQLIFIRHGAAQDRVPSGDDFARRLTNKGEQTLKDTLPALLPLIEPARDVQVWSSPLIRAKQTAQIVTDILKCGQSSCYDFIEQGDFDKLLAALQALKKDKEYTVIVVGHEPFLGAWSLELCGSHIPFKKGAAAGYLIDMAAPDAVELQWFLQPGIMDVLCNRLTPDKVFAPLKAILEQKAQTVMEAEEAFLADALDIEKVHQLRVSIRVLRSWITFVKPFQKTRQNADIQSRLRKFVKELSYLREIDVLRDACDMFSRENLFVIPRDSMIFDILDKERVIEIVRLTEEKKASDGQQMLRDMRKDLKKIPWKLNAIAGGSLADLVKDRFTDLYEAFEQARKALDDSDEAATHALRKRAKKLRYILSSAAPLMQSKESREADVLKQTQDSLGALCDARRNKALLQEFSRRDLPESAHKELEALIEHMDGLIRNR